MGELQVLTASDTLRDMCVDPRERKFLGERGPMLEFEADETDTQILKQLVEEYKPIINEYARLEGKKISQSPRAYGPRELRRGTLTFQQGTVSVLIPLMTKEKSPSRIIYLPVPNKVDVRKIVQWEVGHLMQVFDDGRIVVEDGVICFEMIQYDVSEEGERKNDEDSKPTSSAS